jgi:hypothetical protein
MQLLLGQRERRELMQRYPGMDQRTRWTPARYVPPTTRIVWRYGRFVLHRSGAILLALVVLAAGSVFAAMITLDVFDLVFVALLLACAWPVTVSPAHHELAHALMARRVGIAVERAGFHAGGAYVVFRPDADGVTVREWIRVLSAGIFSNLAVGTILVVGWSLLGDGWFTAGGLFCLLASSIEYCIAVTNAIPQGSSDGGAVKDALRVARSPLVL